MFQVFQFVTKEKVLCLNSARDREIVMVIQKMQMIGLQSRGLKCGGTLQERAQRLFLLKSTPLHKLPNKFLAKKKK
ncbi:unnamed protein product [Brassica oleracea]